MITAEGKIQIKKVITANQVPPTLNAIPKSV